VSAFRSAWAGIRARPGPAAIVCLGFAWAFTMHSMGWAQLAHYAQVRAFADGQAEIDPWHWETNDKAWIDGHFYSVKSPGTAALTTPLYVAMESVGGLELAEDAAANAGKAEYARWAPAAVGIGNYGYDPDRAEAVEAQIEDGAPVIWALTLLAAVIPAVLLLLGVRWAADRIEPGYGTAAAITLGVASMVMIFASEYFSHVIAAALGFAAFLVLWRERDGDPSVAKVVGAGVLAGLAITFEYQVGLVGVVLFFYALARSAPRFQRGAAFALGGLAGVIPALAFNAWALGSPFEFAYGAAVDVPGFSGHERLGLNDDGFFGITAPRLDAAVDLLVANRGLLVLTPVIAAAVAGVVMMRRGQHRTEANVILAVAAVYFVYNAGYWLTFGGGTPGPRFLIPALPFVALGLATAYRRMPAVTLGLAIPSALMMVSASLVYPLLGEQGPGTWFEFIVDGRFEHTLLSVIGVANAWVAIAPVVAAVVAACVLAARATPETPLHDLRDGVWAVCGWAVIAVIGPSIAGDEAKPLDGDPNLIFGVVAGAAASLLALTLLARRQRRQPDEPGEPGGESPAPSAPEPALGSSS
jgi:hypothetical protein